MLWGSLKMTCKSLDNEYRGYRIKEEDGKYKVIFNTQVIYRAATSDAAMKWIDNKIIVNNLK